MVYDLEIFTNLPTYDQYVVDEQGFIKQRVRIVEKESQPMGKLSRYLVGGTVYSGKTMQRIPHAMIIIDKGLLQDTIYADMNGDYTFYIKGRREVSYTIMSANHFYKEFFVLEKMIS